MNWKAEAIDQLSRYEPMLKALENIPRELRRLEQQATDLRSTDFEKTYVSATPQQGDDRLISNLIKRQALQNALENAKIWVGNADNALSVLTPEEKHILLIMYIRPAKGAAQILCQDLCMEQSSIYRKRDTALYRFTMALFGIA